MRAIAIEQPGGPEVLAETAVPDPIPAAGEVLIQVAAAGVNRADLLQRQGFYPPPPGASEIPGLECSGVVTAIGPGVERWQIGDRVAALLTGGGYAERVTVPAGQILPVPEALDLVDAAALPEAVCTAWSNLVMVGGLRAGEVVLIHGGSGGVGSVAIQLAAAIGATVVATAGGPERVARCRQLGAANVIDHRGHDVAAAVRQATGDRGAGVVLDILGAGALQANLKLLATGGRLVIIGLQQGRRSEIDLGILLAKRASVHGTTLRSRPTQEKESIVAAVEEHAWPMLHDGRLRPIVHARLPLREADRAHELLASGEVFGKIVLVP